MEVHISTATLETVLEATGYLSEGEPAAGVVVDAGALASRRGREFVPDALWRGPASLTVYFKSAAARQSLEDVADWRREIWNEGFAPLLWIVSPDRVDIYNGFGRPMAEGDAEAHRLRTFETVERALQRLDAFAGRIAMETGQFWTQAKSISRQTSVDRQLLADLAALERDLVDDGMARVDAQALISRVIFTQYLLDRRIVGEEVLAEHSGVRRFPLALRDHARATRLFRWLTDVFNGDIFSDSSRLDIVEPRHLARAADFLEAVDPTTGQTSLFPYQFDVMPVELISSIYEQFAHSEPPAATSNRTDADGGRSSEARDMGVHYTRLPVVSLVLDEVMAGVSGSETVLDLTCGSGVFLVEALRRLVAGRAGGTPTRDVVRSTLHEQVFGVDISESAVRVAAFSLYLAALELDPDPQPPEALTFRPLIGENLIVGDARDVERIPSAAALRAPDGATRKFDVIVGNPPWTFRGKAGTLRRHSADAGAPRQPRGEALDFLLRAADFGHETTRYGMVLSAPPFFAGSKTGAAAAVNAVRRVAPVTLVNLTAMAGWLFPTAKMPAVVLLGRSREQPADQLTVVNVPWSPASERSFTFSISPRDIVTLSLDSWDEDPTRLKTAAFGRGRDVSLLDYLRSEHGTLGGWLTSIGSSLKDGLILGAPSQQTRDARHLRGLEVLRAQDLEQFAVPDQLPLVEFDHAQWPRSRETYRAPLLLVKEFLRQGPRTVTAVVDRDVVFTDAYFGASVGEHRDEAGIAAAVLSSTVAAWFFLLTASEFGVWKRRLLTTDVRPTPMPDLRSAVNSAAGRRVLIAQDRVRASDGDPRAWAGLDETVFELFGLRQSDQVVVRDGLLRATWQWKSARAASAAPADVEADLLPYVRTLLKGLDAWLSATQQRAIHAEVYSLPKDSPLRVVRLRVEAEPGPSTLEIIRPQRDLASVLAQISERIGVRLASHIVGERELRVHGRGELVIIKPAARRFWTRGRAVEDADAIVKESFEAALA